MLSYNHFLLESKKKSIHGFDKELRELENLLSKSRRLESSNKEIAEYHRTQAEKILSDIYAKILPKIEYTKKEFEQYLKKLAKKEKLQEPKIVLRIKSVDSIVNKVIGRGKDFSTMGDLVAASIITREDDEPEKIYKNILRKYSSNVVDAEAKRRGGDPKYGNYGTYHVDMLINGMVTELQIMTRKMWSYKKAAHNIYSATRAKQELSRFDQALSKKLFSMGNMPSYVREYVEMYDIDDVSLLEEIFEKNYVETT